MPSVTVAGAGGQTVTLDFDSNSNAVIAQQLASAISTGVAGGTIRASSDTADPPKPLPSGIVGEFVKTQNGLTVLPVGYKALVATALNAIVIGSGDLGESVLAGTSNLTFEAITGAGSIVAGGGNDNIVLGAGDTGAWQVNLGNGDDTVVASGSGNDTLTVGTGQSDIVLGSGADQVTAAGADTIYAGSGAATIDGTATSRLVIYASSGNLTFVGGAGGNTVFGGTGSETLYGGGGTDVLHGGDAGDNLLTAGSGSDTLFGSTTGTDVFQFIKGNDGTDVVSGFIGNDKIHLGGGFTPADEATALATQQDVGGSTILMLPDGAKVTFLDVTKLTGSNFS